MLSTGRPLDAEFQPTSGSTLPPSDGADMVIQDFNAFFEKLSGLDDVRWNDETGGTPPAATSGAPARPAAQAAPQAATARPVPQAQPSATPAAPTPSAAPRAPAQPAPARAAMPAAPKKPGLPLPFKLAMLALVLFAVGMGAGWLALSLPRNSERTLAENPLVPFESAAKSAPAAEPASTASALPIAATPAAPAKAASPAAQAKAAAASAAAKSAGTLDDDGDEEEAAPAPGLAPTAPIAPTAPAAPALTSAAPAGEEPDAFSQAAPVAAGAPVAQAAAPAAAAMPALNPKSAPSPAAKSAPAAGDGKYAVQVGACTSARCVETYRKLLAPHLGTHAVSVVQLPAAGGQPVQRVRVAPLERAEAQSLKQALEQADARLKHAYVVRLADR